MTSGWTWSGLRSKQGRAAGGGCRRASGVGFLHVTLSPRASASPLADPTVWPGSMVLNRGRGRFCRQRTFGGVWGDLCLSQFWGGGLVSSGRGQGGADQPAVRRTRGLCCPRLHLRDPSQLPTAGPGLSWHVLLSQGTPGDIQDARAPVCSVGQVQKDGCPPSDAGPRRGGHRAPARSSSLSRLGGRLPTAGVTSPGLRSCPSRQIPPRLTGRQPTVRAGVPSRWD